MKRVLILGASYTQTPLYEAAKKLGIETIAGSIPGPYPGFDLADETAYMNIADPDECVAVASELNLDGVCTCGLDLGMRAIGAISDTCHLPGPSRAAAERAGNKFEMKKALVAAGVQTARFFCIHNEEELEAALDQLTFPVILKAVDQMGSRGIFRSNTREEARENFHKSMEATAKDYCLVEEFIEGEIFGVEAMIQNGQVLFMLPNNIEAFVVTTPTPVGHSVPFKEEATLGAQVREQTEKAIRALGLDNCPVNCDFIKRDGKVYVIELTGRSGATGLSEMTGIYYGLNYYEMILRLAVGEDVSGYFTGDIPRTPNLTHTLMADRKGIVREIVNRNAPADDILDLSFNIQPGDPVQPYTNGRDRIGQVILKGTTLAACERRLKEILDQISLRLEGDLPIFDTPIMELSSCEENRIFCKREDTIPFSFGGNKVRFAQYYLEDMERKGANAMILYGGYHSNLCRILSAACLKKGIPCSMIHMVDDIDPDEKSCNMTLIQSSGVKEYRCHKDGIAAAVQKAMDDFREQGFEPYYIHGNIYGKGNETTPMRAYVDVYREICQQERTMGISFDYIFLATSTNSTQSGLVAAHAMDGDNRKIIGISVTRSAERAIAVIGANLKEYQEKYNAAYRLCCNPEILVEDAYLAGGYGCENEGIRQAIRDAYLKDGMNLDATYTGKAFWGMQEYLKSHHISGKNILFLHTGGTPLFFDALETGVFDHA